MGLKFSATSICILAISMSDEVAAVVTGCERVNLRASSISSRVVKG